MSIKILVDINLSPQWVDFLNKHGIDAVHWSTIGDHKAKDYVIMQWAKDEGRVVFTHDLDFGTLLALTRADSPSVIQMRTQDVLPQYWGKTIVSTIEQYTSELIKGALIVLDDMTNRVRVLPLK